MIHLAILPDELWAALGYAPFSSLLAMVVYTVISRLVTSQLEPSSGSSGFSGLPSTVFIMTNAYLYLMAIFAVIDAAYNWGALNWFLGLAVVAALACGLLAGWALGLRSNKPGVTK